MFKNKAERTDTVGNISVGIVAYFFRTNVPDGWLILDGSANLLKSDFPELWLFAQAAIAEGVTGFVDVDSDQFGIPDARGSFIRGVDNGKGLDPDGTRTIGDQQLDAMQQITGSMYMANYNANVRIRAEGSGAFSTSTIGNTTASLYQTMGQTHPNQINFNSANSTSPNTAKTNSIETRPINLALLPCIRYET